MSSDTLPVIYSGVDTSRFHPNRNRSIIRGKIGIDNDTPLVVMVARFQEVKGHHTFQAMAKIVAEAIPSVHFVVAGEDTFGVAADDSYKNRILENAKTDPILQSRLHYIGFRDDVEHVYSAGDVYVCASNFESYGKANIEAMACGIPVVTTNQGGTTETVINGETGFFAPANDAETLAKHVIHLLNNPDERKRLGENGRRRVEEIFSASATGDKYVEIFERLLEGRE